MLERLNGRIAEILKTTCFASSAEAELERTLLTYADTYLSLIHEKHRGTRRRLSRFTRGVKLTPSASAAVHRGFRDPIRSHREVVS